MSEGTTACVIDSYEVRVRCVDRNGDVVGVFGREGEGPGEFGRASALAGGADNTVGVVDNWLGRFSVFGLWIATQRDRDEFSYLDLYDPAEAAFVGGVRVGDRIEGFDLLGSTLVVLVERQLPPNDPDGIADRAVDWYDVSEWR